MMMMMMMTTTMTFIAEREQSSLLFRLCDARLCVSDDFKERRRFIHTHNGNAFKEDFN